MRYAIAAWNFRDATTPLPVRAEQFADMGFDTISFLPEELLGPDGEALAAMLARRRLAATVHGNFGLPPEGAARIARRIGPALLCMTFDAAMRWESTGCYFDARRMRTLLEAVEECTRPAGTRFGVEDFPLDARALDLYRDELGPVARDPRFGMLLDAGHMNMRRRKEAYYAGRSVEQYIAAIRVPVIEVHLHDNTGEKDSHGHFGFGNLDFSAVAAGLRGAGFSGVSTIEIAPSLHGRKPAEALPLVPEAHRTWRGLWEG